MNNEYYYNKGYEFGYEEGYEGEDLSSELPEEYFEWSEEAQAEFMRGREDGQGDGGMDN